LIFVDFENLQKINENLIASDTKIIVFVGVKQDKTAIDFVKDYFNKAPSIELIKINVQGHNALDFCITFYVGYNIEKNKYSHIIIYSKDEDYDPLINHLKEMGINIERLEYEENIQLKPQLSIIKQSSKETDFDKKYKEVIKHLKTKNAKALPRKIKTLETYLQKTASVKNVCLNDAKQMIEILFKDNIIEITNKTNDVIKFNKIK
jgi:uncharacterized protein (UPF0335 family)